MKRLIPFLFFVLAAPVFAAQDTIVSTVCFQDAQGNCLSNGLLTLDLSQPAKITGGGGLSAPIRVSIILTSAGVIPASTLLWGNDQLTPSGTTYRMRLYSSSGLLVADFGAQSIQGVSPVDLSQLTPVSSSGGTVSYPNPAILNGNNTFIGTNTFTGQILCKNFENIRCVDSANSAGWGGTDIGAWINSAYADVSGTNGIAIVRVQPTNGCINFSTPITFTTAGKQGLLDLNGACLNYTPTTATIAFTKNDGPATPNYQITQGIANGTLTNNGCTTNGGCGSSATGVSLGATPSLGSQLTNVSIQGFGTAINAVAGATNSWGAVAANMTLIWNTTGITLNSPYENFNWNGGRCVTNGTCLSTSGNTIDVTFNDVSVDANTTVGISNSGIFTCNACHFENNNGAGGGVTTHFITSSAGTVNLNDGFFLDDQTTGNTDWWIQLTGGAIQGNSPFFFSAGRTATAVLTSTGANAGWINYYNNSPSVLTSFLGGTTTFLSTLDVRGQNLTLSNNSTLTAKGAFQAVQAISNQGTACTNGELALSGGWQSTGSATVTAVAGNGQTCSWTITTGTTTAANPTVTDTLTNALPAATTVCEMNIHGGTHTAAAGEGFQQTTLSASAPVFTFNGTPTAGGTTYFVTRRCGP